MTEKSKTARGATDRPLSFWFGKADTDRPDTDSCDHTTATWRAGVWFCKRCGVPC